MIGDILGFNIHLNLKPTLMALGPQCMGGDAGNEDECVQSLALGRCCCLSYLYLEGHRVWEPWNMM